MSTNPHKDILRRRLMMEGMRRAQQAGERPGWEDRAYCKVTPEIDPELFFPEAAGGGLLQVNQAKRVCRQCTEVPSCLAKALDLGNGCQGVWGGTSDTERRWYRTWLSKQPRQEDAA